jgi:hypothetical protein
MRPRQSAITLTAFSKSSLINWARPAIAFASNSMVVRAICFIDGFISKAQNYGFASFHAAMLFSGVSGYWVEKAKGSLVSRQCFVSLVSLSDRSSF